MGGGGDVAYQLLPLSLAPVSPFLKLTTALAIELANESTC